MMRTSWLRRYLIKIYCTITLLSSLARVAVVVLSGVSIKRACTEYLMTLKKVALAANPSRQATDDQDLAFLETYLKEHGPEIT